MDLKQKIVSNARKLFLTQGIKCVTMEDIARHLGISKKTLYQHVDNKEHLIGILLKAHVTEEDRIIHEIRAQSTDAIDEMLKIGKYVLEVLRALPAQTIRDIQKYYARMFADWDEIHRENVYSTVRANLERGKTQGLYRSNLDSDVLARIYVESIAKIVDETLFPPEKYHPGDLYEHFLRYHLNGVVSQAGYAQLQKHFYEHFNEAA